RTVSNHAFPEDTHVTVRVGGPWVFASYPVDTALYPYSPYTETRAPRSTEDVDLEVFIPAGDNMATINLYADRFNIGNITAEIFGKPGIYTAGAGGADTTRRVETEVDAFPDNPPLTVAIGDPIINEQRREIPFTITRASGGDDSDQLVRYGLRVNNAGGVRLKHGGWNVPEAGIEFQDPPARGGGKTLEAFHGPVGSGKANRIVYGTLAIGQDSLDGNSSNVTIDVVGGTGQVLSTASVIIGDADPIVTIAPAQVANTYFVNQTYLRTYPILNAAGMREIFQDNAQRALPVVDANAGANVPITVTGSSNNTREAVAVRIGFENLAGAAAPSAPVTATIPVGMNETTIMIPTASGSSGIFSVRILPANSNSTQTDDRSPLYTVGHQNVTLIAVAQANPLGDPVISLAGPSSTQQNGTASFTVSTGGVQSINNITVPVMITGDAISSVEVGSSIVGTNPSSPFNTTVEIAAGETEVTFQFITRNAALNSTIGVVLGEGVGYKLAGGRVNSPESSRLVVVRDIGITLTSQTVTEGDTATITMELFPAQTDTVTATYSTSDGSAGMAGDDYRTSSGSVTFAPGETTKTFTVATVDNNVHRAGTNAVFNVNATAVIAGSTSTASTSVTIADNDAAPVVPLAGSSSVQPNGTARFTLRTDGITSINAISVPVRINGSTDQINTFSRGGSFFAASGTGIPPVYTFNVEIAAGETENTFGFDTINAIENETIDVAIAAGTGYTLASGTSPRVVTVRDIGISLIALNAPVGEGSAAEFTLELFPEQTSTV
ncbi:MAG: hypothetical protein MJE68_17560, partial [Proteobacteria bacterium]|nr:hypothetical protein [Pseudomonadota bacterium]